MEWPVPRRRARVLPGEEASVVASPTGCWAAPRSTDTRSARPNKASTSSPATTAHLNDLVSYSKTQPAREDNRDGENQNRSWNCGVDGPATTRRSRGCAMSGEKPPDTTMLSLGVPMILMATRCAGPSTQQQRLLPGQSDQLVRLDAARSPRRIHRFVISSPSAGRCAAPNTSSCA